MIFLVFEKKVKGKKNGKWDALYFVSFIESFQIFMLLFSYYIIPFVSHLNNQILITLMFSYYSIIQCLFLIGVDTYTEIKKNSSSNFILSDCTFVQIKRMFDFQLKLLLHTFPWTSKGRMRTQRITFGSVGKRSFERCKF